jgi:hypothetical protein
MTRKLLNGKIRPCRQRAGTALVASGKKAARPADSSRSHRCRSASATVAAMKDFSRVRKE